MILRFLLVLSVLLPSALFPAADELAASPGGSLRWSRSGVSKCNLSPMFADRAWKFAKREPGSSAKQPFVFSLDIGGRKVSGTLATRRTSANEAVATWTFVSTSDWPFGELALTDDFAVGAVAGGTWKIDERTGTFPTAYRDVTVVSTMGSNFSFSNAAGEKTEITFPERMHVLIQDNRRWGGPSFSIRIGHVMNNLGANAPMKIELAFRCADGLELVDDLPVEIAAGDEWVPLPDVNLDIVPDSILDLSRLARTHAPCGANGFIRTTDEGHFVEEKSPDKPLRFYGINLCFSAQYLEHGQTDRLLDRLVRLGYNTIRLHHYENELTTPEWKPGFEWDPKKLDRLDYLVAGCARRGIYLTTDLYVNRPVPGTQIGLDGSNFDAERYKQLVLVHEPAYQDLLKFVRLFLGHKNPYTGRTLAEEPTLAWISLVNEGPIGHGGVSAKFPQWKIAWNRYLAEKHVDPDDLDVLLGDLKPSEDPTKGTVELPLNMRDGTRRSRAFQVFLAETERNFFLKMKKFLHEELRCRALLTDINSGGARAVPMQLARNEFDYVDEHFYIDHPIFATSRHGPPSASMNSDPVRDGALGGSESASVRIWGKPFTVSEFNYSGPGRYRGVGGLLVGAMASLQDWDVLWRFAYAHRREFVFEPNRIDYFDMARDPLNQAADRLAAMLFLSRAVRPFENRLSVDLSRETLEHPPRGLGLSGIAPRVWDTALGSHVADEPAPKGARVIPPRRANSADDVRGLVGVPSGIVPADVVLNQAAGTFVLDTPAIAGGYGSPGATLKAVKSGITVSIGGSVATVVLSAMDGKSLAKSSRLLVTHLTDLQNSGAKYGETARRSLNDWGDLPYLVRDGQATVTFKSERAKSLKAWVVAPDGRRLAPLPVKSGKDGTVTLELSVRGESGARFLYELAEK